MGVLSGTFLEKAVMKEVVDEEAVKAYSVELTVEAIYRNKGRGVLAQNDSYRDDLSEVPSHSRYEFKQRGKERADSLLREYGVAPRDRDRQFYWLDDLNTYAVEFAEEYEIPEGHVGVVHTHSKLADLGAALFTGIQEPNTGEETVTLFVDGSVMIEDGSHIGELVVYEAAE